MIKNEKEYRNAMKKMIRYVQSAKDISEIDPSKMNDEESEILYDCIVEGYIRGKTSESFGNSGQIKELRAISGKALPEVHSTLITHRGLAFLKPDKANKRSIIALWISIFAAIISALALAVSILSNLDKIIENWHLFISLFASN